MKQSTTGFMKEISLLYRNGGNGRWWWCAREEKPSIHLLVFVSEWTRHINSVHNAVTRHLFHSTEYAIFEVTLLQTSCSFMLHQHATTTTTCLKYKRLFHSLAKTKEEKKKMADVLITREMKRCQAMQIQNGTSENENACTSKHMCWGWMTKKSGRKKERRPSFISWMCPLQFMQGFLARVCVLHNAHAHIWQQRHHGAGNTDRCEYKCST